MLFFLSFSLFLFQLLKVADTLQNQCCSTTTTAFSFEVVQKENISAWLEYFILPWEKSPDLPDDAQRESKAKDVDDENGSTLIILPH